MLEFLQRCGDAMVRPRAVARRIDPDAPPRGDVWALIAMLLAGSEMPALGQAVARLTGGFDWGNALMTLATLGHVFLPPIVLLWLCEILLGRGRDHARALGLVPFVTIVVASHSVRLAGGLKGVPTWGPQLLGAAAAVGLALWIRPAIRLSREGEES